MAVFVIVTWIFVVDAVRLWPVSIHPFLTAARFSGNHLIVCGIPTVPLCHARKQVKQKQSELAGEENTAKLSPSSTD